MFSYNPRCKMLIPPFSHHGVMRYGNFVPRLYNLCRSLDYTPGKIMPARAFCSDEKQGYPLILQTSHVGYHLSDPDIDKLTSHPTVHTAREQNLQIAFALVY